MNKIGWMLLLCLAGPSHAYDGASSELSHVGTGALLAGVVTRHFQASEQRAWMGFAVSTAAIVLAEYPNYAKPGRLHGAQLDVASHVVGAALGAWLTDRYVLTPFVSPGHVGLVWTHRY